MCASTRSSPQNSTAGRAPQNPLVSSEPTSHNGGGDSQPSCSRKLLDADAGVSTAVRPMHPPNATREQSRTDERSVRRPTVDVCHDRRAGRVERAAGPRRAVLAAEDPRPVRRGHGRRERRQRGPRVDRRLDVSPAPAVCQRRAVCCYKCGSAAYVAKRGEATMAPAFGHATSRRLFAIWPPRAMPAWRCTG